MDWLSLSLLCALLLAATDALTKKWMSGHSAAELVIVRLVLSGLLLAPLLLTSPLPSVPPAFWGWVAAALPLEIIAMSLYMIAIREAPLALTLPYLAFTPVFVLLTGWLMLGETVSPHGLAGIVLVTLGAYVLNLERATLRDWRSWANPFSAILHERGSRLMLAVAFIYSIAAVLGKGALQYMPASSFGALYFVVLAVFSVIVYALWQPRALRVLRRPTRYHWIVAALMAAMVMTHFLALEQTTTAYMIAVKRTSALFGVLFGAWLFHEARLGQHLIGAALMVGGVAIIAWHTLP